MRPGYIALIFWFLAACAAFGIINSLLTWSGHGETGSYRVDKEPIRFMMLVRRPICLAPVAMLLGRTRKRSRLTGSAPLDFRYASINVAWLFSSRVLLVMYCEPSPSRN